MKSSSLVKLTINRDVEGVLEVVAYLEKEFGIKIKSQELGREVFSSVSSLSQFIESRS